MGAQVELSDVSVVYGSSVRPAVDHLNLSFAGGERVALVGPSGAGKSTIISLVSGLVLPTTGNISTLGVDTPELFRRQHRSVRRRIGTVHQDFALIGPLRVTQNVAAGRLGTQGAWRSVGGLMRPRRSEEIADALERVGIAEKMWDRADQLSGGQQQRVAVARLLYQDPQLVLADEPCSNLDPAISELVMAALVAVTDKAPDRVLVTSLHDAPLALKFCQRVVGLRDGSVQFDAPATDVTPAMLDELYRLEDR